MFRQPVGFFVLAGTRVLEVEVERAVGVLPERHPTADRETIQRVGNLESFGIVKSDRPEGVARRRSAFFEVD